MFTACLYSRILVLTLTLASLAGFMPNSALRRKSSFTGGSVLFPDEGGGGTAAGGRPQSKVSFRLPTDAYGGGDIYGGARAELGSAKSQDLGGFLSREGSPASGASPTRDAGARVMSGARGYLNDDESNPFPSPSRGIVNCQLLHYSRSGAGFSRGGTGGATGSVSGGESRGGTPGGRGKAEMPIVPWDD